MILKREEKVYDLIKNMNMCDRTTQPLSELWIAQQCGGSDAFSGITANPCIGQASMELIQHGGKALIAETTELMSAET
eukprot:UN07520